MSNIARIAITGKRLPGGRIALPLLFLAAMVVCPANALAEPDCTLHAQELDEDWTVDLGMVQVPIPAQHRLHLSNGMEADATSPGFAQLAAAADMPPATALDYMLCAYLRRAFTVRKSQDLYSELSGPNGEAAYLAIAEQPDAGGSLIMITLYLPQQLPE